MGAKVVPAEVSAASTKDTGRGISAFQTGFTRRTIPSCFNGQHRGSETEKGNKLSFTLRFSRSKTDALVPRITGSSFPYSLPKS